MPRALPDSAHGYVIEAEGRGAQEHQEGSRGGAAEEDDLEAAEEDPHRSREAGQQGEETAGLVRAAERVALGQLDHVLFGKLQRRFLALELEHHPLFRLPGRCFPGWSDRTVLRGLLEFAAGHREHGSDYRIELESRHCASAQMSGNVLPR